MLNPLSVSAVTMTTEPDGRSLLRMRMACSSQADWSHADLSRLSLYLGADAPVSSQLHLMLTKRQAALYMRLPGQTDRIRLDGYFSPGGFAEEDGLWPKGDTAFSGYQLLLEYFTFRDKFMFVHFNGTDGITPPAGTEYFDIEVVFSTPWPSDLPVTDDAVRLHCVPVINLFTTEADPLTITGWKVSTCCAPNGCRTDTPRFTPWIRSPAQTGRTTRSMCRSAPSAIKAG